MAEQFLPGLSPLALRLQSQFPHCEILALCFSCNGVRVTIDHPDGVNVNLTTQVAKALRPLLPGCGIEVSSPGIKRPLLKREHFQKVVGSRVSIKTHEQQYYGQLENADSLYCTVKDNTRGSVKVFYTDIKKAKKCK